MGIRLREREAGRDRGRDRERQREREREREENAPKQGTFYCDLLREEQKPRNQLLEDRIEKKNKSKTEKYKKKLQKSCEFGESKIVPPMRG